jgi:cytochrome oxidase Cu insertion factor (SCO1/SenC/PrrC family)
MSKKIQSLFALLFCLTFCISATTAAETNLSPIYQLTDKWVDDSGKTVLLSNWKGKNVVMSMAYSTCKKFCPLTIRQLLAIQKRYDEQKIDVEFIVISYDPSNDTPQGWEEYRKLHNINRPNWHFLTGNQESTKIVSQLLGMDYWLYDEHVMHNFKIVRLNTLGEIDKTLDWNDQDNLDSFLTS